MSRCADNYVWPRGVRSIRNEQIITFRGRPPLTVAWYGPAYVYWRIPDCEEPFSFLGSLVNESGVEYLKRVDYFVHEVLGLLRGPKTIDRIQKAVPVWFEAGKLH